MDFQIPQPRMQLVQRIGGQSRHDARPQGGQPELRPLGRGRPLHRAAVRVHEGRSRQPGGDLVTAVVAACEAIQHRRLALAGAADVGEDGQLVAAFVVHVLQQLGPDLAVVQVDVRWLDQRRGDLAAVQVADDQSQQPQHPARALEAADAAPAVAQDFDQGRVKGIGPGHQFPVFRRLGFLRKIAGVAAVVVPIGLSHATGLGLHLGRLGVEQAALEDFVQFLAFGADLDLAGPAQDAHGGFDLAGRANSGLADLLLLAGGHRQHQGHIVIRVDRAGQLQQELLGLIRQVASTHLQAAGLGDVGEGLVDQEQRGAGRGEKRLQSIAARRHAHLVALAYQVVELQASIGRAQPVGDFSPQRAQGDGRARSAGHLPRLAGADAGAVDGYHPGGGHVYQPGFGEQLLHRLHVGQAVAVPDHVVEGQQGMGLAAAEDRRHLGDADAVVLAGQAAQHARQGGAQPTGQEGAAKESVGVLVLGRGFAGLDLGQVHGEDFEVEPAFADVAVGSGDLPPG